MEQSAGAYTPLSKQKESLYASLESKKHRRRHGLFMAQGSKSVADTLPVFRLRALCADREWLVAHANVAESLGGASVFEATESQLRRISSLQSAPHVIAVYELPEPEPVPSALNPDELYLLLDGIQDPGNLGTIIRTADWFGVHTVFASPDTADVFNAKTLMATMGSIARVKVIYTDLCKLVDDNSRMPLYGTLLDGTDIYGSALTRGGLVAFGNEGNGLSQSLRRLVTAPLLIPPYDNESHAESLNVGVATAITLSEFRRRFPKK